MPPESDHDPQPADTPEQVPKDPQSGGGPSWGNMSEEHWSKARADMNSDALDYLRERSQAPGVAEGGAHRNQYCMECHGVIPLEYDSRVPDVRDTPDECPHCGAPIEGRVQAMFNWVEIDQVHGGDARAVLIPLLIAALALLGGLIWFFVLRD